MFYFAVTLSLCLLLTCLSGCDTGDILSSQGGDSRAESDQEQATPPPQPVAASESDFECRRACTLECIGASRDDGFSFQLICIPRSYQGEVRQDDIEDGVVTLIDSGEAFPEQLVDECAERPEPVCEGDEEV